MLNVGEEPDTARETPDDTHENCDLVKTILFGLLGAKGIEDGPEQEDEGWENSTNAS